MQKTNLGLKRVNKGVNKTEKVEHWCFIPVVYILRDRGQFIFF